MFTTSVSVLETRWQHGPSLECSDTETVWITTHSKSTWHDHVLVVGRSKPGSEGNGGDWYIDIMGDRSRIELCVISANLIKYNIH